LALNFCLNVTLAQEQQGLLVTESGVAEEWVKQHFMPLEPLQISALKQKFTLQMN
jgi:hypothetical protein